MAEEMGRRTLKNIELPFAFHLLCRGPGDHGVLRPAGGDDQVETGRGGPGRERQQLPETRVVQAIRDIGIKLVRLEGVTGNNTYTLYNPAAKRYDWTGLDREIETIQSSGAEIILNLYYMPSGFRQIPRENEGVLLRGDAGC